MKIPPLFPLPLPPSDPVQGPPPLPRPPLPTGALPLGGAPPSPSWPPLGAFEAIRLDGRVLLREPLAPWPVLAVSARRNGPYVTLSAQVAAGGLDADRARAIEWIEAAPGGAWVGSWSIHGSTPGPEGAMGWSEQYALHPDGTFTFSAYPALAWRGAWSVEPDGSRATLDGTTLVLPLARPASQRRALGPLASARLRVMLEPRTASVMAPWQSVELETNAAGVVVFALPLEIMCLHVYADGFASVTVTP